MAGNGNARGGLGWVILVVALAVPGVLFYNWWSHLKAEREKSVAAKARGRVPDGGVFQSSSPNNKLVNPMTPVASTEAVTAQAPAAAAVSTAPALAQTAQAAVITAPAPGAAAAPASVSTAPAVAAALAAPGAQAALSFSSSSASLPLKRDPTLSPFDQVRLVEEEQAKLKAAEDLAAMQAAKNNRGKSKGQKPAVDPRKQVELQGIISNTDSGFKAIVNNEVMSVGEFVAGTRIKIVKITDLGVTFDFQGKRFVKGVSQ